MNRIHALVLYVLLLYVSKENEKVACARIHANLIAQLTCTYYFILASAAPLGIILI